MTARIGVVGIGWWATFNHIPTIDDCPEAEIVAICDLDRERLDIAGDRFGIPGRYTDINAMLAAERLDGVMVSTPHVAHTAPAISALQAGAHVLIEKPMATTRKKTVMFSITPDSPLSPLSLPTTRYQAKGNSITKAGIPW